MSIGAARSLVEIQRRTRTRDATGGHTETWEAQREAWAKIEPVSAGKRAFLDLDTHELSHEAEFLEDVDVKSEDRLVDQATTRVFMVTGVQKDAVHGVTVGLVETSEDEW